ncbi:MULTISPECIES: transposase [unclassified Streptomyces]|uniref:transposase n=1 Tax=unclassified Streptomyces TaxID=2593676 RepID=UPI0038735A5B
MGVNRAALADGQVRPVPRAAAAEFEGVNWPFKTGGQWREMPQDCCAWSTVHNRFRQWRDAGAFDTPLQGLEHGSPEAG